MLHILSNNFFLLTTDHEHWVSGTYGLWSGNLVWLPDALSIMYCIGVSPQSPLAGVAYASVSCQAAWTRCVFPFPFPHPFFFSAFFPPPFLLSPSSLSPFLSPPFTLTFPAVLVCLPESWGLQTPCWPCSTCQLLVRTVLRPVVPKILGPLPGYYTIHMLASALTQ